MSSNQAAETVVIRGSGRMRLLLSGGGNRAMLGGAGAMAYLVQHGFWDDIDEVVSVSGGSTVNAAVLTRGSNSYDEALAGIGDFYLDAARDRGQPWFDNRRWGALTLIVVPIVGLVYLILAAIGLAPGPRFFERPMVGLGVGFIAPFVTSVLVRRGAGAYLRQYLGGLSDESGQTLDQFRSNDRQHVICATGIETGEPYYLFGGGGDFFAGGDLGSPRQPHPPDELWGHPTQADIGVGDAVFASSSLPTLGHVQVSAPRPDKPADQEVLIDGGVSGIFGRQVSAGLKAQGAAGAKLPANRGHIVVVDSGRHVARSSDLSALIYRLSVGALLARWLKVSLEASYRRDLEELDNAHLVRIAEGFHENEAATEVARRYDVLRAQTAQMGLYNYNAWRARNAFVTGWVGCALTLDEKCSEAVVEAGLAALGEQLGVGDDFLDYWRTLGASA